MGNIKDDTCDIREVNSGCSKFESCVLLPDTTSTRGLCKCLPSYSRHEDGLCHFDLPTTPSPEAITAAPRIVTPVPDPSGGSSGTRVAAGILIPLMLVACAVGVLFMARRYKWLQRLRQMRTRRYDEMRIGQEEDDDPPIA
uniref:Uncharacterized protein n=1 Tax=Timema cristinae TaxID=61476 RepID=A0A7R9GYN4_TIMCR|nr:unnamed protein product [Timema cristinae]